MSRETLGLSEDVLAYIRDATVRETEIERRCREETAERENANMQISAEQGQVMKWLVRATNATRTLEIGTFTGYSALCVAGVLPDDGGVVACELDEDYAQTALTYAREAGLDDRIDVRLGPAAETLTALVEDGESGAFDFAFIDADKGKYVDYYERCVTLVGSGGVIALDNTLWGGSVADPSDDRESTEAIRDVNERVTDDDRVTSALIPIGDGLTVAYCH